ncbi:branched-chain amino acid transporter AzlD [Pseudoflavonifractor gallinarum]|uniref:branched-chain amino acid transporter permease n=1 Tax=Pseudoflavonifractor gallinarum TaxID=2779352 RepID=UPI0036F3DB48
MLTPIQAVAAIAVMAVVTFLTRALPFLLFDRGDHPPKLVLYLGRVLPPAIIAMLIIYCLKGPLLALRDGFPHLLALQTAGEWLPAFLSVLVVALLHLWKRNTLLSIFGGTVLYMVLIQAVFP